MHKTGGFRVQGREAEAAERMIANARALESAGADLVLLECIPTELGREVTELVGIPTIGIGAGPYCDGQVLVYHDLLGIEERIAPRFVRRYAEQGKGAREAIAARLRPLLDTREGERW